MHVTNGETRNTLRSFGGIPPKRKSLMRPMGLEDNIHVAHRQMWCEMDWAGTGNFPLRRFCRRRNTFSCFANAGNLSTSWITINCLGRLCVCICLFSYREGKVRIELWLKEENNVKIHECCKLIMFQNVCKVMSHLLTLPLGKDLTDRGTKRGTSFTSTMNVFRLCICVDAELCTLLMDQRLGKYTTVWSYHGSILFIKLYVTDLQLLCSLQVAYCNGILKFHCLC
jgi:hypothetical protein